MKRIFQTEDLRDIFTLEKCRKSYFELLSGADTRMSFNEFRNRTTGQNIPEAEIVSEGTNTSSLGVI